MAYTSVDRCKVVYSKSPCRIQPLASLKWFSCPPSSPGPWFVIRCLISLYRDWASSSDPLNKIMLCSHDTCIHLHCPVSLLGFDFYRYCEFAILFTSQWDHWFEQRLSLCFEPPPIACWLMSLSPPLSDMEMLRCFRSQTLYVRHFLQSLLTAHLQCMLSITKQSCLYTRGSTFLHYISCSHFFHRWNSSCKAVPLHLILRLWL